MHTFLVKLVYIFLKRDLFYKNTTTDIKFQNIIFLLLLLLLDSDNYKHFKCKINCNHFLLATLTSFSYNCFIIFSDIKSIKVKKYMKIKTFNL